MDFFIQDSWKINPRLTLNYGVRYDLELTAHSSQARISTLRQKQRSK